MTFRAERLRGEGTWAVSPRLHTAGRSRGGSAVVPPWLHRVGVTSRSGSVAPVADGSPLLDPEPLERFWGQRCSQAGRAGS